MRRFMAKAGETLRRARVWAEWGSVARREGLETFCMSR
jgi:hypothetical protein